MSTTRKRKRKSAVNTVANEHEHAAAISSTPPTSTPAASAAAADDVRSGFSSLTSETICVKRVECALGRMCMIHFKTCDFCPNVACTDTSVVTLGTDYLLGVQACDVCLSDVEAAMDALWTQQMAPIHHLLAAAGKGGALVKVKRRSGVVESTWRILRCIGSCEEERQTNMRDWCGVVIIDGDGNGAGKCDEWALRCVNDATPPQYKSVRIADLARLNPRLTNILI
jgi:hypothetical protein